MPAGRLTYKWAALVARYRVMPHEIARLTDAQIDELLLYPRDKEGGLKEPEEPDPRPAAPTRESRLREVNALEAEGFITPQRARELREEVERRGDPG